MLIDVTRAALAAALIGVLFTVPIGAQEMEGCDSFQRYVDGEDYPRALEELDWCRRSVENLHFDKIKEIVGRSVLGYEPNDVTVEAVLGFATVEADYTNGSDRVGLSLTGGGAAAATGLGALAGLASAFGVRSNGTNQVRVAGLTGQMEEDEDEATLTLTLEGGMLLVLTGPDADTVEAFAEEIIPVLEDYLG